MEMMTPRKQDSQAAVVQNLTSDRLLVSILAEKAGDRRGENSYRTECRTVGEGMDTINNTVMARFYFSFANLYTFLDSLWKHLSYGTFKAPKWVRS